MSNLIITNEINKGVSEYMGRIEHITTQQIIGEWGSIDNFASSHGLNPVELIETLRMKEIHPDVLSGLKQRGYWGALETGEGAGSVKGRPEREVKEETK